MPANIAPLPGEGCVESVAIVTNWRFSSIKIAFDTIMVVISVLMCYFFYTTPWGSVNIGTIIYSFTMGFFINLFLSILSIPENLILRILFAIFGVIIYVIAVALFVWSNVGVKPWIAFALIFSKTP